MYGKHLIRGFLSVLGSAGGLGKTSLTIVEALAMVTGRPLLGEETYGKRLRVWLWNLEDPADELRRRITAAMVAHGIKPEDVGDRLFVDSGRDQPLCLAKEVRGQGAVIQDPVVETLIAELRSRSIDALIIDPFVSSHQVSENDNTAIDLVAKKWAAVAHRAGCAILLVHHVRKLGGFEATAESVRGAKALVDAARSVRVINPMSKEEAEKAGLETHRGYFRVEPDKTNLAPPDRAQWARIEGVRLGNGDTVGVVRQWTWPDAFSGVGPQVVDRIMRRLNRLESPGRASIQSGAWVGHEIGRELGMDTKTNRADKARVAGLVKVWQSNGALVPVTAKDFNRHDRACLVPADRPEWKVDRPEWKVLLGGGAPPAEGGAEQGGAVCCSTAPPAPPPLGVGSGGGAPQTCWRCQGVWPADRPACPVCGFGAGAEDEDADQELSAVNF